MKHLIFIIIFMLAGCSENIDRKEYMDKIKELKLKRSESSRELSGWTELQQNPENKEEINIRLLGLQKSVNDLPGISGWDKDDSLKIYFTGAIDNDLAFYNKIKNRTAPSNFKDSLYFKTDEVKHMERSLYYDLLIMRIIIDQEKELIKNNGK
jgi:hypothetical protein